MFRSEKQMVEWLKRRRAPAGRGLLLGIGDDAALLRPPAAGTEWVLTTDLMVEDVHFLAHLEPARSVGHRALARGLSDVAAMGGRPRFALVSLALSGKAPSKWFREFHQGLQSLARRYNVTLVGGDTALSPRGTVVDTVLVGEVRSGFAVRRSGASPGDRIFVSGGVGLSAWGGKLIRSKLRPVHRLQRAAVRSHLYPTPRCTLGERLALNRSASAMIDVSDGLALDLHRLCEASGVGARLGADSIPHPAPTGNLLQRHEALRLALEGGEDYELLFTVSPKKVRRLSAKPAGVALTEIGEITRGRKIEIVQDGKTRSLASGGYDHFRRKKSEPRLF